MIKSDSKCAWGRGALYKWGLIQCIYQRSGQRGSMEINALHPALNKILRIQKKSGEKTIYIEKNTFVAASVGIGVACHT